MSKGGAIQGDFLPFSQPIKISRVLGVTGNTQTIQNQKSVTRFATEPELFSKIQAPTNTNKFAYYSSAMLINMSLTVEVSEAH